MTNFFPSITSRDYLKIDNEKRYAWEFLDREPKGFLTALGRHTNKEIPEQYQVIWDCGAWAYRKDKIPPITVEVACSMYSELGKANDIVTAPDHMLLPNTDTNYRRRFNTDSAKEFIKCIDTKKFIPMATIHGIDQGEQLSYAQRLIDFGYTHLAIGGLAARSRNTNFVITSVREIKNTFPEMRIHVFGVSAPKYAKEWHELGITSFDGSSHFLKALTKGIYLDNNLNEFKIKNNKEIPICYCVACRKVRELGEDTRQFGNSTRNIGRAVHNLNMLMGKICI